ncbi:anti sigma factor [Corynebacterium kutscheri]|uniref:Anti sigma factor n=1 Tax=Corynebacterium kutscheri TaxID=35755 RepID=A0A0F6TCX7_9CORY|nr:mycothiol system anti-sigma-R factor [Corynebacterium kutscheri]AKE40721.1 mycothiol system anti-sigma-R factor [Corynebacterium kutscheri]VEH04634.1 anti sigma factor [Corynebacterium kutscheri]VEH11118.1 anti sigma factor [Corynebacterium kutscheri]VEH80404.1 anti sigma factor [Corynebacterium kutscheri]
MAVENYAEHDECVELRAYMFALLDQELTAEDCARLNEHVDNCPHCREMLEAESELRGLLRKCCCDPAPGRLRERITYSIRIEQQIIK